MGYALHKEKTPLGQKVEDLGLRLENVALSHCCVRGKCAANDKLASGAVLPGQYFDEETNLHYNHFRYYDPELGRYVTSDPIGLQGGVNTYLYANASPIIYIDPFGLRGRRGNNRGSGTGNFGRSCLGCVEARNGNNRQDRQARERFEQRQDRRAERESRRNDPPRQREFNPIPENLRDLDFFLRELPDRGPEAF